MHALKSTGGVLLGIAAFVGIIIAIILVFSLGAQVAFAIAPFINGLASVLIVINVLLLLVALIPSVRATAGIIILISSYIYGLSAWIYGLAVSLALWGWIAVIIGMILGGVGVVPIGLLASILTGHWEMFWPLLLTSLLTYAAGIVGSLLIGSAEIRREREAARNVLDVKPEENKRTWKDVE